MSKTQYSMSGALPCCRAPKSGRRSIMPTSSPSRTTLVAGRALTALTMDGKRSLKDSSLREKRDTSRPLRTARHRNPSSFGSNNHSPARAVRAALWRPRRREARLERALAGRKWRAQTAGCCQWRYRSWAASAAAPWAILVPPAGLALGSTA